MKKAKLVLIADDFTGSNDTGVQFSKKGLKTVVMTDSKTLDEAIYHADVLVVDTESRFDSKEQAYHKTKVLGEIVSGIGIPHVYKKLDSTLRGNIGAEIQGAMEGLSIDCAIVAAAYPSAGRTTVDGQVYVHNVLLEKTEVARDPKNPVNQSRVTEIINNQSTMKTAMIDRSIVTKGDNDLFLEIMKHRDEGARVIVVDGEKAEDLKHIAETIARIEDRILMVGSAGLAEFLPDALDLREEKSFGVIVGSISDTTRKQADFAVNCYGLEEVSLDINAFFANREYERERIVSRVVEIVERKGNFVLRSTKTAKDVEHTLALGYQNGFSRYEVAEEIAHFIGETTKDLLNTVEFGGLMLTGGDVAIKTAQKLDVKGTLIQNEILPGIPYGYFIHDTHGHIPIVTKAGAFGEENSIASIIEYFRKE